MTAFVYIDHFRGKALPSSWEALGAAKLMGEEVTALIFGYGVDALATLAFHYGADRVILCDDATLSDFRLEPFAALLSQLVKRIRQPL